MTAMPPTANAGLAPEASPMAAVPAQGRKPAIVILDFGSQYSELIARRVRETEVFSLVMGYATTAEELRALAPRGIILSGGPSSVYEEGAPVCDPALWELGIPVLGVCYGMQLMVQQLGAPWWRPDGPNTARPPCGWTIRAISSPTWRTAPRCG